MDLMLVAERVVEKAGLKAGLMDETTAVWMAEK